MYNLVKLLITNVNMLLSEKLKEIMLRYKLTSAQFADKIGVPRSSISHILNGRNKPSLDFIMKLMSAYPSIDLYWLLGSKEVSPTSAKTDAIKIPLENGTRIPADTTLEQKRIEKIIILYDDETFHTYNPAK